ncbi:MAG TPA: DUF4476 domain-containing protein [Puia sp.]|nr:DUF4476 domain-containing protein [Puia sp.]
MLKNALTALLFLLTVNCLAQQNYFVLIQADNNQPFYAQLNGKTFSSSDIGHLIIPQLKDSSYKILIGFPKNQFPQENFEIAINKKDQSFQLKNLGEKGWALFNTLTMELKAPVKSDTDVPKQTVADPAKKEDAFAKLMAGVVNDTAVLHKNVVEEEEPKKETTVTKIANATELKTDTAGTANKKTEVAKVIKKPSPPPAISTIEKKENNDVKVDTTSKTIAKTKQPLYRVKDTVARHKNLSFVKKLSEQKTDTSYQMQYVDIPNKGATDTIDVIIPFSSENITAVPKKEIVQKQSEAVQNIDAKAQKSRDTVRTVIDTTVAVTKKAGDSIQKDTGASVESKTPEVAMNKDCKSFANGNDIDKLRIQMLAIDNDDDKIATARNIFKAKCFSVKQVRALSEVFKTDEGKYKFFDATYLHVADVGNFVQLQDLLSDSYYINRFKAMIR